MALRQRPPQIKNAVEKFDYCDSELVIGLVCAVGADYGPIKDAIVQILQQYDYAARVIRISDLIPRFTETPLAESPETARIAARMTAGNSMCRSTQRKDFWALASIAEINAFRQKVSSQSEPAPRTAHIILTLKRPEEVATLRKVYGDGFFLVGIFATEAERLKFLIERNAPKDEALALIKRDAEEATDVYGQYTRETFHLSDFFVESKDGRYIKGLDRLFSLIFSDPYITPTRQEYAMFLAYAASLRSAQLGRQVGSAISSVHGDILAVGCNDVPKPGGGLYWVGDADDHRDHVLKHDSNDTQRDKIIDQLLSLVVAVGDERFSELKSVIEKCLEGTSADSQRLISRVQEKFFENGSLATQLRASFRKKLDITEYGRAVHAEMDALLTCARSRISPKGALLYTTTFPCHNCTRHIIAAGIEHVYYIEPYAKSKAEELHSNEIVIEEKLGKKRGHDRRVPFTAFVGIGPRRYFDLFSLTLSTGHELIRKSTGEVITIEKRGAWTRIPLSPYSYLEKEEIAVEQLDDALRKQLDMFGEK